MGKEEPFPTSCSPSVPYDWIPSAQNSSKLACIHSSIYQFIHLKILSQKQQQNHQKQLMKMLWWWWMLEREFLETTVFQNRHLHCLRGTPPAMARVGRDSLCPKFFILFHHNAFRSNSPLGGKYWKEEVLLIIILYPEHFIEWDYLSMADVLMHLLTCTYFVQPMRNNGHF